MKVLLYLYFPFFDHQLAGGVQVWLRRLVDMMIASSPELELSILCPKSDIHDFPDLPRLYPVLDDLETEYLTTDTAFRNLSLIKDFADSSDVVWLIDRTLPVQTLARKLLSLNTICYEREVMAFFSGQWDRLVVLSDFEKDTLSSYKYRVDCIRKVPSFTDGYFTPRQRGELIRLRKYFDFDYNRRYILFPHRPDRLKGHMEALDVVRILARADSRYCMLIPEPPDSRVADAESESTFVSSIKKCVAERGLSAHVTFHKWVPYEDLPLLFSCGEITLFLSRLPETFGSSLVNSIGCGTPVISYGTGALEEIIPPGNAHFVVDEGDTDNIARIILDGQSGQNISKDIDYIHNSYRIDAAVKAYMDLFRETAVAK
jgi:glycosyltransferase involved in cell wall biosynthesis